MPEGPETRRAADRIARAIHGQTIERIEFAFESLRAHEARLRDRKIVAVRSHGKALLTDVDCGWSIYSHNQLYGRWFVRQRDSYPETNRELRLAIHMRTKSALLYSASEIDVWRTDELDAHPFLAKLGPDLLDASREQLADRLREPRFGRSTVGRLLLDQSFVAGNGNYLRSEILYFAELAPERKLGDLEDHECESLLEALATVGRRAYRNAGVTNPPDIVRELKRDGLSRRASRHAVFGRSRQRCLRCGETIERIDFTGRRLYVCRGCQR